MTKPGTDGAWACLGGTLKPITPCTELRYVVDVTGVCTLE